MITTWCYLIGGLEHVLFSPIVWMMIQYGFHIFQRGRYTTNQRRKIKKTRIGHQEEKGNTKPKKTRRGDEKKEKQPNHGLGIV